MQANTHVYIMPIANSILTSTKQQTTMTSASMYVLHVCVCVCVCGVHANCAHVHVYVCACQYVCVCVECLCMLVCLCACACVSLCVCLFLLQVGSTPCGKCETLAITTSSKAPYQGQQLTACRPTSKRPQTGQFTEPQPI